MDTPFLRISFLLPLFSRAGIVAADKESSRGNGRKEDLP